MKKKVILLGDDDIGVDDVERGTNDDGLRKGGGAFNPEIESSG